MRRLAAPGGAAFPLEEETVFNAYEFTFAGESSLSYGVMLYDIDDTGQEDVSFGNKA